MFDRYFKEGVTFEEAETILKKTPDGPGFLIRRSRMEGISEDEKKKCHIIRCDEGQNPPDKLLGYSISYISNTKSRNGVPRIKHIRFYTEETDPKKLNEKFEELADEKFRDVNVIKNALDLMKSTTIEEKKKENCVLIHVHRDGKLRPEEINKVRGILAPEEKVQAGVLIISTQTPTTDVLSKGVAPGKTGLELKKILTDSQINQSWIIITGHGETAGDLISGDYTPLFETNKKLDIEMGPADYVDLLIQGGLKAGTDVNIILNVCYSGAREEKISETGHVSTVERTSFAEKLAEELAKREIASIIVASKTTVDRFGGKYLPRMGEEKDTTMLYRVKGGPADIRIVRTTFSKIIIDSRDLIQYWMQMSKGYKHNFVLSKKGIGFADSLNKDLRLFFEKADNKKTPIQKSRR